MDMTIYHNPACGTSRKVLELITAAGIAPRVIAYLETPPTRAELEGLIRETGGSARHLLREKEPLCAELGLSDLSLPDGALVDAMLAHPVLMNRPVVVSPRGTALCRPADLVLPLLPPETTAQG